MFKNWKIWVQSAGDTDRNYVEICLRWGVILNGPGRFGSWPDSKPTMRADGVSSKKCTDIERFAEQMSEGDIVLLRLGTKKCVAVGKIVGKYEWSEAFGDVDGWDLQHVRRVDWLWKSPTKPKLFETYSLNQGDTTQRLPSDPQKSGVLLSWLESLNLNLELVPKLVALPNSAQANESTTLEGISDFLFDAGVASESINGLVKEMDELVRIAKWYQRSKIRPSEFETIGYLAIPLLRA